MYKVKLFILLFLISQMNLSAIERSSFTVGNQSFLLNNEPFLIRGGEIHYPRIPKEYWEHRIQMCKAMGMNTICIYLFWNYHEQKQGEFNFSGNKDIVEFIRLIQKNGMYCIVRPGPYVCAEWDMGGLPWWLLKNKDLQVRTLKDVDYMNASTNYLRKVAKLLSPLQIQNGGNIIMVQVENEYGVYGNDSTYMNNIKNVLRTSGFDKVLLFRCDWSSNFFKYEVPGVLTTLNFGAGSNVEQQFKKFQEVYPELPRMCSEYWSGWFDYWGRAHETRSISSFIGSMKDMMDKKISVSLYMAHGGTSFGQWGGANVPPFGCMVTSYDYNAPINEAGQPTDKFYAVRNLMMNYLNPGEKLPEIPKNKAVIEIPELKFTQSSPLFHNLPQPHLSKDIMPMEMFNQGWGQILYRTKLGESFEKSELIITELHDWASVYLDGEYIGQLDRRRQDNSIILPPFKQGATLDILVDAMGRVNYGKGITDRKGITEKVELVQRGESNILHNWEVYSFPVEYKSQKRLQFSTKKTNGPAWYKAYFNCSIIGDTYIDMSKWGKGMVWVNGNNIGRYWKIGPQQTLYLPGCWLKKENNEIVVLDFETPLALIVQGVKTPVLDKIVIDSTMLSRKLDQSLNLNNEQAIDSGEFNSTTLGWKEVTFSKVYEGKYFCFEALNAIKKNDNSASVAEIELIDENGQSIDRSKWKVVYADSEEISEGNYSAEKVFDQQETTFWSTSWTLNQTNYPHQIVIDLGKKNTIKGFRYLPRNDSNRGQILLYRLYIKCTNFKI